MSLKAVTKPPVERVSREGTCTIAGCTKARFAKGYCSTHYYRVRDGRPIDGSRVKFAHDAATTCKVIMDGKRCGKDVLAKGLCRSHYDMDRKDRPLTGQNRTGGVFPLTTPKLPLAEKMVFTRRAEKEHRSVYDLVNDVCGAWARQQPEYEPVQKDQVMRMAPDLIAVARMAANQDLTCRCGECSACVARRTLEEMRLPENSVRT